MIGNILGLFVRWLRTLQHSLCHQIIYNRSWKNLFATLIWIIMRISNVKALDILFSSMHIEHNKTNIVRIGTVLD